MILLDSSAWIEIFRGTQKGNKIKEIINDKLLYTCIISISEITKWCYENNLEEESYLQTIEENSTLLPLKKESLVFAGKLCVSHKKEVHNFGLIDACIYSSAHVYGAMVLTTNHHFEGLEGVSIVE